VAANYKLDAVIHLAALGSVPLSYILPTKSMNNNIVGFTNVLELAKTFECKKFVFASSSAIYGRSMIELRAEGGSLLPNSPYGLSKKVNEELAVMLTPPTMNFVGLRFFNVYGPGQSLNGYYTPVIPNFITKEKPEVYGDGEIIRDFTYVDDVCNAIIKALFCDSNVICNVGTGIETSLNQLLEMLDKKDVAVYTDKRQGDVQKSYADTKYAKKVLNFQAMTILSEGIKKTKAFYDDYKE
jgi:nucleoside-diphosphate-sugar epimerase